MRSKTTYKQAIYRLSLSLLFLLHLSGASLWSQAFRVMEYGADHGMPQPYIYTISQDTSGYLWVGTGDGLARYDGNNFQVFTTADSLGDDFITTSIVNKRGIWLGHMNGAISLFNGKEFIKVIPGNQGTSAITDIKIQGDFIWASTQSSGLWRIGPGLQNRQYQDPSNPISVFSLEMPSSTECILGSIDGVYIYSIDHEQGILRLITPLEGIPETRIQDLLISKNDRDLYILSQDEGIFTYNLRQFTTKTAPLGYDMEIGIEGPQQIFEDGDMNLWIPTFGLGVYKLIPDKSGRFSNSVNFTEDNGLPGNNVRSVLQDREGNIWLGMYGTGLVRLVDEAFTYYTFEEPYSNNVSAYYTAGGEAWYGTDKGLIKVDSSDGERRLFSGKNDGLPSDIISAVTQDQNGNIWIGSGQNGLYRMLKGTNRFRPFYISDGILENSINALATTGSLIWAATDKGVCKIETGSGTVSWFTLSNAGLPHNTVNYLQVGDDGKIWLSTLSNTVSYIQNDSVTRMNIPIVGAPLNIRSIAMDMKGRIWVGTNGNGVFMLEGDSVINLTSDDGLISNYCYSLVSDDKSYIWISHHGGLSRIRINDGFVSKVRSEAGISRSMEFNTNAVFKDKEGTLWFGSTEGMLRYDPRAEKKQPPAPALSVTSVIVDNKEWEMEKILQFPPGRHDLRINFMGINLKNPDAVRYRYKMEGLGNAWSEEFTENQVTFNGLPDGKYTFYLSASNSEGISSESPVALQIIISKPLWKRWWFYALILILVSFLITAYIKRREYNLRLKTQILEKAVVERTEEVVKQKEEIERQSDQIQLINKNITDSITYARRIQKAVFPPTEHLTRLFPESFIMNRPQYIVSGDFFWVAKKDEKMVVTVADCTGHGVPGAFMSMLGITLLNEIVNNEGIVESDQILNRLKNEIIQALRQTSDSESASDGMDMALCVYDPGSAQLQYSGGFNSLMLIRNGELERYKADPMPIGIGAITGRDFTKNVIDIKKGDHIYLFTDGYEDQFGGERDKKFSRKRFRELLIEIHKLSIPTQSLHLEKVLDDWMDGREQIDDITVMGIRF